MPTNVMKLVIQLEATSEKQLQLCNQLLATFVWDARFPVGISWLTGLKYKQMQSKMR